MPAPNAEVWIKGVRQESSSYPSSDVSDVSEWPLSSEAGIAALKVAFRLLVNG
jgi:hypothetical protein